ncbi:MAG TPA: hypothetical protein VNA32_04825, partial [Actinomycetota bacterium]|nr:hypothetical protein [Actinomycetota bacterium]
MILVKEVPATRTLAVAIFGIAEGLMVLVRKPPEDQFVATGGPGSAAKYGRAERASWMHLLRGSARIHVPNSQMPRLFGASLLPLKEEAMRLRPIGKVVRTPFPSTRQLKGRPWIGYDVIDLPQREQAVPGIMICHSEDDAVIAHPCEKSAGGTREGYRALIRAVAVEDED